MHISHIIRKSIIALITSSLIVYLGRLWTQGATIIQQGNNQLAYLALLAVCLYIFINYVVYYFHISWSRMTLFLLGLILIVLGDRTLINDPAATIYIGDLVKLLGVILVIAGPAKLFISQQQQEDIKESNMEIIEV